ncbi:MAG: transglycosylase SLT domain-containing protein [Bacteroidetes bacterium]|jgi:hypothetical protein|nr:transglycosylase SLT domain-containing protein [Bacteroidota bacterium]
MSKTIPALLILLVAALSTSLVPRSLTAPQPSVAGPKPLQEVSSPPVPLKMTFAGEEVPLHDPDIAERLEKEILSNTFYHSKTLQIIKLANRWRAPMEKIMKEHNLPSDFFYLAVAESALDENAISSSNAVGMWQFMASAGQEYKLEINTYVDQRRDPYLSTMAAAKYINDLKATFGTWTNAAAAYNRGKSGLQNAIENQKVDSYYDLFLNPETYRYVFRILAYKAIMESPDKYGFALGKTDLYPALEYEEIQVDTTINDLPQFAKDHRTTYKMLKKLNPWMDVNAKYMLLVPSGKSYTLRIPKN